MKNMGTDIRDAIRKAISGTNRDRAIASRVTGDGDDLAGKYVNKMKRMGMELNPPDDENIFTLWLGNLHPDVSDKELNSAI